MGEAAVATTWDGRSGDELAEALSLPRVVVFDAVDSTMDVANALAADGAPAGTLVLADTQLSGRGRAGRRWESKSGDGIWMTLLERLDDVSALDVLSLRVGLGVARALDRFAGAPVGLKWPNDLYLAAGKLGGVLVESRWRGPRPEWTAIGVGINVRAVSIPGGAALGTGVSRGEVLGDLVPGMRAAASARGVLTESEHAEFSGRDIAAGRLAIAPARGRVRGIAADGALLIETDEGLQRVVQGSLILEDQRQPPT